MKHEDQEAQAAGRSGLGNHQVRLDEESGAAASVAAPPSPRWRFKRSVEVFPASDGSIYLLRLGAGDDLVLSDPAPAERRIVESLAQSSWTQAELARAAGCSEAEAEAALADLADAELLEFRAPSHALTREQRERYSRQLIYLADLDPGGQGAEELQARLGEARVVVIGCGGLGSWVASTLSGAGVGELVLVDQDRVELSNLNRQILFSERQIGQLKVEAAAESLRTHNRELEVTPVQRRISGPGDLADLLHPVPDIVVCTGDWPPHELPRWVNEACMGAGVPWIGAGQFPPRLRVGPLVLPGRSACLECQERRARRDFPLYDELGAWRAARSTPDSSLAPVTGAIGCLLASECFHFLVGRADPRSVGAALLFDLQTMELEIDEVQPDPDCPACASAKRR